MDLLAGLPWRYRVCGQGPAVVLLPGALGGSELAFHLALSLAGDYQVIAVSYPNVQTMAELADGVVSLLERHGHRQAHVVGGSYGGLVAQVLARRYRDVVRSLILSHTGVPRVARARTNTRVVQVLSKAPMPLVRWLLRGAVRRVVAKAGPGRDEWRRLCDAAVDRVTREDLIATYARAVDLDANHTFEPGDVDAPVLLIASSDDHIARDQLPALQALYPAAAVARFHGTGHATAMAQPDEYARRIAEFLRRYTPKSCQDSRSHGSAIAPSA